MPEDRYRSEHMRDERATQIQLHLAECSTEVLENELAELIGSESDSDETLDLIDTYLAELEKRPSCEPDISAEESLQNFHEKYATIFEVDPKSEPEHIPKKRRHVHVGRFIATAAVIAVMVSLLALQASGIDLLGSIAQWTSETFQLIFAGGDLPMEDLPETNPALTELQTALDFHGVTAKVAPKYLPEGYEQVEFHTEEDGSLFVGVYQHKDNHIIIQISKINNETGYSIQKNIGSPEIYSVNEMQFIIMTNSDQVTYSATWQDAGFECVISNVPTREILYNILNSIN